MRRFLIRIGVVAATLLAGLAVATPAHAVSTWFSNEYTGASVNVNGTYQALVGDFAGDDHDDIIWYAPGPTTDFLWTSNGNGTFAKAPLAKQVNGTYIPLVGDFGKDNHDDIFWYKPGSDADYLWMFQSGQIYQVTHYIAGVYTPVVLHDSQFGSGDDDILWYAPGSASDSIWTFNAQGAKTGKYLNVPGSPKPLTGDFDGNGIADVFWYNPGTTPDYLWRGTDGQGTFTQAGFTVNGTFAPVVQDFTEGTDGRSDILWFRPGAGADVLWEGTAGGGFSSSPHTVPGTGTPIGLTWSWGYVWTYDPAAPDRVWYVEGADYDQQAGHTELGAGYTPLVGRFAGTVEGIFWYKAGSAPEYLMN